MDWIMAGTVSRQRWQRQMEQGAGSRGGRWLCNFVGSKQIRDGARHVGGFVVVDLHHKEGEKDGEKGNNK